VLALTPLPQYLSFTGGEAEAGDPVAEFTYDRVRIARGDRGRVTLILRNPSSKPLSLPVSIEPPAGWTVSPKTQQVKIPKEAREVVPFEVTVPSQEKEPRSVQAKVRIGDQTLTTTCRVEILEPLTLNIVPDIKSLSDPPAIAVTVQNNRRSGPVSGTIRLAGPEGWRLEPETIAFENIAPYGEKRFPAKLAGGAVDRNITCPVRAIVTLSDGISQEVTRPVGFTVAIRAKTPPVIDGNLEDWAGAIPMEMNRREQVRMEGWGGPKDLSAKAYIMWDETALYFAVQVTDDQFSQPFTGEEIWKGDSIQMGFAPFPGPGIVDYFETGMALTPKGKEAWAWHTAMGLPTGPMDMLNFAARRTGDGMIYEAAVPAASALGIVPGKVVGFSILVNDNDGSGRRGWIEWGEGIGQSKDPGQYRYITFVE